ncbi:hypothetical protein GA566_24325 [Cupriavidus sp. SW-Y-13]|nr:hypothetical protein [Cupriavidus sp. SW-Y-13]
MASVSGSHCRQARARDRTGNARVSPAYSHDWRDNPAPKMATLKKPGLACAEGIPRSTAVLSPK